MHISDVQQFAGKPFLYAPGSAFMWTDPHISKQLLAVHLNENIDLASRKKTTIETTVKWILSQSPGDSLNILDLGCGPGLYAEMFARIGHMVTGWDISATSINHAEKSAEQQQLPIAYHRGDYLKLNRDNLYDLIILIYTDFGVLLPEARSALLKQIHRALKPGGVFVFDVLQNNHMSTKTTPRNWEISLGGFWRDIPYIALSESFLYEEQDIILYQHIVATDSTQTDVYRFWTHFFSTDKIASIVRQGGFSSVDCVTNVLPGDDAWSGENVIFCVARK